MSTPRQVFKVLLISILLFSVVLIFRHPHSAFYDAIDAFVYSTGNAPEDIRAEITEQQHKFQEGYTQRDTDQVEPFMEALFSQDNLLLLGTMPDEIYSGQDEVSKLIYSDWNAWGDCTFLMDNAHISTLGDTAWISTIGYVLFDVPRFLNLPLRLSAS